MEPHSSNRGSSASTLTWALAVYIVVRLLLALVVLALHQGVIDSSFSSMYGALIAPWHRWDVEHFLSIAEHGYGAELRTTSFHPLYGWLGRGPGRFSGDGLVGLLMVSAIATIALFFVLERWSAAEGIARPRWGVAALLMLPSAYVLWAPYSESVFLLATTACLWMARQRSWWIASASGGLASLTRPQGLVLALPLALELADSVGGWRNFAHPRSWRLWLTMGGPLMGYGFVVLARLWIVGGMPAQWWIPQNWVYGLLLSPQARIVAPGQEFVPPWVGVWRAIWQLMPDAPLQFGSVTLLGRWVDLGTGGLYVALLALCWRRLRPAHRVYCAAVFLLTWSYHTGALYAYMGMSRHLLLAVPLVLPMADWAMRSPLRRLLVLVLAALMLSTQTALYVLRVWVP